MKIVQIVLRMEFESINTSKKHYITVHYKKILRHGALSYRYERLLFFLILFKNKISYSRNNRKVSPNSWVFKTTFNPCSTKNGNSTCDSKRPKMAILVSSDLHDLEIQIGKHRVVVPLGFSGKLGISFNLLGRTGIFDFFNKMVSDPHSGDVSSNPTFSKFVNKFFVLSPGDNRILFRP